MSSLCTNNGVDAVRFVAEAVNEARECAAEANAAASAAMAYAAEAKEAVVHMPESIPTGGALTDRRVYIIACAGGLDLSDLTVETYGTCEVWIDYTSGSIVWPDGWYWLDGTNSASGDHDVPPSMDKSGYRYRVVARNEGVGTTYAHVAYKSST